MNQNISVGMSAAIRRLIDVSGCFAETYENLCAEWLPDQPPNTIVFSSFGQAFCRSVSSRPKNELSEICLAIEELLVEGNETVKNAVATGFLESILSESSSGRFSVPSVSGLFGPETIAHCKAWDEFTGCKSMP
jgi:hypothetical protein